VRKRRQSHHDPGQANDLPQTEGRCECGASAPWPRASHRPLYQIDPGCVVAVEYAQVSQSGGGVEAQMNKKQLVVMWVWIAVASPTIFVAGFGEPLIGLFIAETLIAGGLMVTFRTKPPG